MSHDPDVIVIGAGVVGLCSGYFLHRRGLRVTILERGEAGAGSSGGNAGLVAPSHCVPLAAPGVVGQVLKWMFRRDSPFYVKPTLSPQVLSWLWRFYRACNAEHVRKSMPLLRDLHLASAALYEEFSGLEGFDFYFEKKGLLYLYKSEAGFDDAHQEAHMLDEIGIKAEIVNPTRIAELAPNLRADVIGGAYFPQDCHLNPGRFCEVLASHLQEQGVEIKTGTRVIGFDGARRRLETVRTDQGDFSAAEIVLAAGSWSRPLGRELHLNLPIEPAKGYSITVKRPQPCPAIPILLSESKVAVTPMGQTLRFGGTLEMIGFDSSINQRRIEAILNAVGLYLPQIDVGKLEILETWQGARPCTPDGLPIVCRSRRHENLTIAAGHAMIGMSLGPITGKLVAEIVSGETPSIDISALRADRF